MGIQPKIPLLILVDCLPGITAGTERQIYELAKGLDKNKYDVTIASLETVGVAPGDLIRTIGCRFMTWKVKRIYGLSGLTQGLSFYQYLKTNKIKIVMTYHFSSDIWGTWWAALAGVPVIISNRRDIGFWKNQKHINAYQWIDKKVKCIIGNSQAVRQHVIDKEKAAKEKVFVINNGLNVDYPYGAERAVSLRESLGLSVQDFVIVCVSNLKPVKGHEYLLKALAHLKSEFGHIKLLLIGEDELNGFLQVIVRELEMEEDSVQFLGKRNDVLELLNVADLCVLPSLSEGLSNALIEYMIAGKAVVATDVGGNKELVDHRSTGLLVTKENVDELKEAIKEMIVDPVKRKEFGFAGQKKVRELFSSQRMVKEYEQLFERLIKSTQG